MNCSQTGGCIKNNALYKIQSAPYLCVKLARAERLLKSHLFLLCKWHSRTKVIRFVFALREEHPLNLYKRRSRCNASIEESEDWEREWGMGAQIMWWSVEAWNTNKRWKSKFRGKRKSEGRCLPCGHASGPDKPNDSLHGTSRPPDRIPNVWRCVDTLFLLKHFHS